VKEPADRRIGCGRGEGAENRTFADVAAAHADAVECTDRERQGGSADELPGDPLTDIAVSNGDGEEVLFFARQKFIGTDDPVTIHLPRGPIFYDDNVRLVSRNAVRPHEHGCVARRALQIPDDAVHLQPIRCRPLMYGARYVVEGFRLGQGDALCSDLDPRVLRGAFRFEGWLAATPCHV